MCESVSSCAARGSPAWQIPGQRGGQGQVTWGARTLPGPASLVLPVTQQQGTHRGAVGSTSLWVNLSISRGVALLIQVPSIVPTVILHHSLCPFHLRGSLPVPECSAAGQWVPLLVSSRTARPEPPSRRSPGGPGTGEPGPGALLGLGVLGLFPTPQRSGCIPTMLPGAILSRSLPAMGRGALCVTMCDPHLCPETLPKLHVM